MRSPLSEPRSARLICGIASVFIDGGPIRKAAKSSGLNTRSGHESLYRNNWSRFCHRDAAASHTKCRVMAPLLYRPMGSPQLYGTHAHRGRTRRLGVETLSAHTVVVDGATKR